MMQEQRRGDDIVLAWQRVVQRVPGEVPHRNSPGGCLLFGMCASDGADVTAFQTEVDPGPPGAVPQPGEDVAAAAGNVEQSQRAFPTGELSDGRPENGGAETERVDSRQPAQGFLVLGGGQARLI